MRQIDLSQFAPYDNDPPAPALPPDPDPNAAIVDGTLAQAFNNDFIVRQQALLHDGPEAFYAKRGADALVATPDVLGNLKTLRDQFVGATVNARQRQILADALDNHLTVSRADIARHADLQQRVWQNTIALDRLDLLHKQAGFAYDDPDSVANYADAGRSAALHQADLAGFDSDKADTHTSNAASAIWRSAIEAALAKDATRPAIALHARAADTLTPRDAAILAPQIEGAREREIGRAYLANIPMPENDPAKPLDHAQVLAALETAHTDATDRNTSDWPDNDSQRATNQHFIDVAFGQKKRDAIQSKANRDQAVADWLAQPDQIERPPLPLWMQLTTNEQKAVDARLVSNVRMPTGTSAVLSDAMPEPLQDGQQLAQVERPEDEGEEGLHKLKKALHEETPEERAAHHEAPLEIMPPPPIGFPGLGPRTSNNSAPKSSRTRAEQLEINKAKGKAFERRGDIELRAEGQATAPQITVKTESGVKVRLDFATRDLETDELGSVEYKASPTARLTRNQRLAFPEIAKSGATIVGKGKPGFPGGTKLPAKPVRVIKDQDKGEP